MAKLQRLQDMYSQYFSVSIRILNRADLKLLTVESNGNTCCLANRDACPDICERYIHRGINLQSDGVLVSMCPFGLLSAIAPLGLSMERGSNEETEYFFVAVDNSSPRSNGEECGESRVASIIDGIELHDKIEFEEKVHLISSAFDLFFAGRMEREGNDLVEAGRVDSDELGKLTKREQDILRLVCVGMSNQQVADELFISEHTVKLHVSNVLRKLNLSNRTQLAVYGIQMLQ